MTIEKHARAPRAHVITTGNFVAVPEGFEGAKGSLRYVLKPEFQVVPAHGDNRQATFVVPRQHVLLDLAAVNLADVDAATIIRDCELVAKAARENFADLQRIIAAFGADGTSEQQDEALAIAERLGLTESAAAKAGGGLAGILLIAGLCLMASCFASCPPPQKETTPPDK